jgi:hypothetical protein
VSTNFYWFVDVPKTVVLPTGVEICIEIDRYDPAYHIGKRSFAGFYCYDCQVRLTAKEKNCKECGALANVCDSPVRGSCTFNWAQDPGVVRSLCAQKGDTVLVEDEYGSIFTGAEFLRLLTELIEEHADGLGERFS